MSISPQKYREVVFLLLYSADFDSDEEVFKIIMAQLTVTKKVIREAAVTKASILENLEEIDLKIKDHSKSYDFERIPRVERNILRLGIYEIFFSKTIPAKVAIAEAIRLTKKFATSQAATFVNAVMDEIYQHLLASKNETVLSS